MKHSILLVSLLVLMKGAVWADPADLIGTWDVPRMLRGNPFVSVLQFHADGLYIQNDYFDERLENIAIGVYNADDRIIAFDLSLFWQLNEDTGEFETDAFTQTATAEYFISGDELNLILLEVDLQRIIDDPGVIGIRSTRRLVVPPGVHTLPDGRTAVRNQSWGEIKSTYAVR